MPHAGIVAVILQILVIVLAVLYAQVKNKKPTVTEDCNDLCLTPYCIKAANYLLDSMDQSVEPCENFYEFACGTWMKNTRIPPDSNLQQIFITLNKKLQENIADLLTIPSTNETDALQSVINARILYRSCLDETKIEEEGVDPVLSFVNTNFGGWPILQGASWDSSKFNLTSLLLKLRQYNYNIIFQIISYADQQNSSATSVYIAQGTLGLPQRQYYESETNITAAYRQFMSNLAQEFASDTSMIEQDVQDIYDFEKNIAKFFWSLEDQQNRQSETVRTTFANISSVLSTKLNLKGYLYEAYRFGDVTLNDTNTVTMSEIEFLNQAFALIEATPPRILQNYFVWRFMQDQVGNMPKRIRSILDQFNQVVYGTAGDQMRTIQCGSFVSTNMGFVVSKLYIKAYFDESARNQSLEMIGNIRESFIGMLNGSTWMDDASKVKAIEKAKVINEQIGYPDYLGSDDTTKLEQDFAEYVFNTSYIHNTLKIAMIKSKENFQNLLKPIDRKKWGITPPTTVDAFYDPSKNQMTFPAAILQMPFFDKNAPKYLNYGGIGMVVGHEMTHGFDSTGRLYDKDGNLVPWWTDETIEKFNTKKQCIIDQYSNYNVPQIQMNCNGELTQSEDIADNGGLKASFYAYKEWAKNNPNVDKKLPGLSKYSSEQLFFINFGRNWCTKMADAFAINQIYTDPHSFGQFRVMGPTSNFDEFDRVFNCKPGQGNSRTDKCTVW